MLRQLCGRDVRLDQVDAAFEQRCVEAPHRTEPLGVLRSDQEPAGLEGIVNDGPLAEELGVAYEVQSRVRTNALERREWMQIGRPGGHRGFPTITAPSSACRTMSAAACSTSARFASPWGSMASHADDQDLGGGQDCRRIAPGPTIRL